MPLNTSFLSENKNALNNMISFRMLYPEIRLTIEAGKYYIPDGRKWNTRISEWNLSNPWSAMERNVHRAEKRLCSLPCLWFVLVWYCPGMGYQPIC